MCFLRRFFIYVYNFPLVRMLGFRRNYDEETLTEREEESMVSGYNVTRRWQITKRGSNPEYIEKVSNIQTFFKSSFVTLICKDHY